MKFIIPLFFFLQPSLYGQTFTYEQIKDSAITNLEDQLGKRQASYFKLFPPQEIDIFYTNWLGNSDVKWLKPGEEVKSKRLNAAFFYFVLKHPNWDSTDGEIHISLDLDKNLAAAQTIDPFIIPEFIRQDRPRDWLTKQERQKITDTLSFAQDPWKMLTSIKYDPTSKKYYYEVKNIYASKNGYYFYENYWFNLKSGKIEKHFFTKSYVCSLI